MSDEKDEKTGELEDEQLANVSGGAGVVDAADLMEQDGIAQPPDPQAERKRFKDLSFVQRYDKSSPL